jgi:hypothetical protein
VSVDAVLQKRNRVEHAEEGRFGQAAE